VTRLPKLDLPDLLIEVDRWYLAHGASSALLLDDILLETCPITKPSCAPMFHLADAGAIWSITLGGGTHVCLADFDPARCIELLERERITATVLVPTMINFLLNSPQAASADFSAWRLLIYGASPMPVTLIRRAASTFGVQLMQAYGMTELSPVVTWLSANDHQLEGPDEVVQRLRSAGRAVPGVEVRMVDDQDRDVPLGQVGEVIVRGPNVMQGYWNQPEVTAQVLRGGWMHTGDMATQDEGGYLYIVDRMKDMIISGGENVYSAEVEDALFQHPALLEAAVIGVPDPTWGEAVKAIVVLKDGQQVSADELRAFCRQRIAAYKVPRSFDFADTLPKTATGKVSKKDLRAPYWVAQSGHGHLTDALLHPAPSTRDVI
jgi:long-chain acyl-CoA synthetase